MPTRYLQVKNWQKFQHYHNRPNAPYWIKVYPDVLANYDFLELTEAERYKLMAIWLLASKLRNKIRYDARYVGKMIGAKRVDLAKFVELGFLEAYVESDLGLDPVLDVSQTQSRTDREEEEIEAEQIAALPDKESLEELGARLTANAAPFGSEARLFEVLPDMDKNSPKVLRPLLDQLPAASIEQCREEVLANKPRRPTAYAVEILTSKIEKRRSA